MPGKHKQVSCKIYFRVMRSDHLKRHMKVHVKRNEIHPTTKMQYNEIDVSALRKMLENETVRYKKKISLGKALDKILGEGKVMEAVLPKDMQNALNFYRNNIGVDVEMEEVFEREDEEDMNDKEVENEIESENDEDSENDKEYENEMEKVIKKEMNVYDEKNYKESEEKKELEFEDENEIEPEKEIVDDEENDISDDVRGVRAVKE